MNHLCSSASRLSLQHVTLFISSKTHYNIFTAVPLAWGLQGKLSCVTFQIFWKEPKLFLVAALLLPNPGASEAQLGFHLVSNKYLKVFKKVFSKIFERRSVAHWEDWWRCQWHAVTLPRAHYHSALLGSQRIFKEHAAYGTLVLTLHILHTLCNSLQTKHWSTAH